MPRKKASSRRGRRSHVGRHKNGRIKKGYYLPCTGGPPRKAKAKRKTTRRRKRR